MEMSKEELAQFERYKEYTERKAKLVTRDPVRLVLNYNARTKNATAHVLKYANPTHYSVIFAGGFYRIHNNNPYVIKNIICHELAHIVEPYDHDAGFRKAAAKLGCSPRYQKER